MSETYFVFTDEAGTYNKRPNEKFRHSHPFYIRANVRFSADDYRLFQNEIDWEIHKGKHRSDFLKSKTEDALKGYYRCVFNSAVDKKSLVFIFTVTCVYTQTCYQSEEEVLKFHLQEVMQRVNMDAQPSGFATIIMDELNLDKIEKLKTACHEIAVKGDFIKYKNIYSGVLTECSSQSAGVQLADFAAGIFNGYLRGALLSRGKYEFVTDLFNEFVLPHLRHHPDGRIMGYGVREVPSDTEIRNKLSSLFER